MVFYLALLSIQPVGAVWKWKKVWDVVYNEPFLQQLKKLIEDFFKSLAATIIFQTKKIEADLPTN